MAKIKVTISVDQAVWDMLGTKISCSKSEFVENCIRDYVYGKNKENNENLNRALETMFRFQDRFNHVGKDKIREVAARCGVTEKDLVAACREDEVLIENFQDDKSHRY